MRTLLLCLLIIWSVGQLEEFYRYENGIVIFNGGKSKTDGILTEFSARSMITVTAMDFSTMMAHTIFIQGAEGDDFGKPISKKITGVVSSNSLKDIIEGTMEFTKTDGEVALNLSCKGLMNGYTWELFMKGKAASKRYYDYKEAGLRARSFIGVSNEFFKSSIIIGYASLGVSHFFPGCMVIPETFKSAGTEAKPGYVIIGRNHQHCGILDHEGDKFIHDSVITRKVVETPLVLASQYFPEGYYFMKYPDNMQRISSEVLTH